MLRVYNWKSQKMMIDLILVPKCERLKDKNPTNERWEKHEHHDNYTNMNTTP